jgi:hypothetical protein
MRIKMNTTIQRIITLFFLTETALDILLKAETSTAFYLELKALYKPQRQKQSQNGKCINIILVLNLFVILNFSKINIFIFKIYY